jgi:hypothetical protein
MGAPVAAFAAPAAARALREGRRGVIELALSSGSYLRFGDAWVLLAEPGAPFGPLTLAVDGASGLTPAPGSAASVTDRRLVIGGQAVSLLRMRVRRCVALDRVAWPGADGVGSAGRAVACRADAALAVARAADAALAALPRPPAPLRPGIARLAAGDEPAAVRALAGLGEGLTPAGDDVLAGYAAWCRAAGARACVTPLASGRSSPLGLAYLRAAEHGELPDAAARLLVSIRRGSVPGVRSAIRRLRSWGASSGIALGWGIAAGAAHHVASHTPRPTAGSDLRRLRAAELSPSRARGRGLR